MVMREAARQMRAKGVKCLVYLDDWLFLPSSPAEGREWQRIADEVWADLGLMRQRGKGTVRDDGSWDIVQDLVHLGVGVNFRQNVFYVPLETTQKIKRMGRQILTSADRHDGKVGSLWLAQFAGLVMSTHTAVRQARAGAVQNATALRRSGALPRVPVEVHELGPAVARDQADDNVVGPAAVDTRGRPASVGPGSESAVDLRCLHNRGQRLGRNASVVASDGAADAVSRPAVCGDLDASGAGAQHHCTRAESGFAGARKIQRLACLRHLERYVAGHSVSDPQPVDVAVRGQPGGCQHPQQLCHGSAAHARRPGAHNAPTGAGGRVAADSVRSVRRQSRRLFQQDAVEGRVETARDPRVAPAVSAVHRRPLRGPLVSSAATVQLSVPVPRCRGSGRLHDVLVRRMQLDQPAMEGDPANRNQAARRARRRGGSSAALLAQPAVVAIPNATTVVSWKVRVQVALPWYCCVH
eukprot:SAG31_NODE_2555_length_5496_cov_13.099314_1_plen_468_part_00